VLHCVHEALGGEAALGSLTSLRTVSEIQPAKGVRGPLPAKREMMLVLPATYRSATNSVFVSPSGATNELQTGVIGFDKDTVISSMAGGRWPGDPIRALTTAKHEGGRAILMLLVRQVPGVVTTINLQGARTDGGRQRLALQASGPSGFSATLLVDEQTCLPAALIYERPATASDLRREQPLGSTDVPSVEPGETRSVRVDLGAYRSFSEIRFPTILKTSIAGRPYNEETVTEVRTNPPVPAGYFAPPR
jgi:hypothetical protein